MELRETGENIAVGLVVGTAMLLPSVSAATILLVTGRYEAILNILRQPRRVIKNFREHRGDLALLSTIGLSALIAIYFVSQLVLASLTAYPSYVAAFFLGLVLSAATYLTYTELKSFRSSATGITIGITIAVVLSLLQPGTTISTVLIYPVSGFIGVTAMLLPGLSGSYTLLLLGSYNSVLTVLTEHVTVPLTLFVLGAITSVYLTSKAVHSVLQNHRELTLSVLIGLMLGGTAVFIPDLNATNIPVQITMFFSGIITNFFLIRLHD